MKKLSALLAVFICAFSLVGCNTAVEVSFVGMDRVLLNHDWERCVYSAEISNGKTSEEKIVYTDGGSSEMELTLTKQSDGTAEIEMKLTLAFEKTPPYARHTGEAWRNLSAEEQENAYNGLTDKITSKVVINGATNEPIYVEKNIELETSKAYDETDKSLSMNFTYSGETAGKGGFMRVGGEEQNFSIRQRTLRNAFDNEQIYYMISAFMRGTIDPTTLETALGYAKQYKIFNLADYCVYGKGPASLTFSVGETKLGGYENIAVPANTAEVTVSFSQGQPLIMRYSLGNLILIGGTETPLANKHVMLGYKQSIRDGLSSVIAETSYVLKGYSSGKLV